ncbi:MAG: RNA polymerase sigma factor [Actinomycetota bacterium]
MNASAAVSTDASNNSSDSETTATLDEAVFEGIYREYRSTLVQFASRKGADDPEAAADHALFEYYRAWDRLRKHDSRALRSFLMRATANEVVSQHRRLGRSVQAEELHLDADASFEPDFSNGVVDAALLEQLIGELSPAQRATILHRFYADLTAEESGQLQGRQANAIHQLQHRALARLQKALLAALLVAVVAAGIWLVQRATSFQLIETDPIGPEPVITEEFDQPRDDVDSVDEPSDNGQEVSGSAELVAPSTSTASDGEQPASASEPTTTTAIASPTTEGAPAAPAAPATTDPAAGLPANEPSTTTSTTTTSAAAAPLQAIGFNMCAMQQIGASTVAVMLFDPMGNRSRAETYVSPSAIRFVDGNDNPVFEVSTPGHGVDGTTSGSAGWLNLGEGQTHRSLSDAYSPTDVDDWLSVRWGVLLGNDVPDNWSTVEYRYATGAWAPAPACGI